MGQEKLPGHALGRLESIIMGIAGAAPAFTISAAAASLIGALGALSLGAMVYCGLIMFGSALAFRNLNREVTNAGAAYSLTAHVFGRPLGFLVGWAALISFALAMVAASVPGATATLMIVAPAYADNTGAVLIVATLWYTVISAIAVRGIKHASIVQITFMSIECLAIVGITLSGLVVWQTTAVRIPELGWLSPFALTPSQFATGLLIGMYFYWGWDVTLNLSEETGGGEADASGGSALWSVVNLTALYVLLMLVILITLNDADASGAGTNLLFDVAGRILPAPWSYVAVLAVMLSTIGTLETQTLQFSRSLFAMARDGHFHERYARIHPQWRTPHVATFVIWLIGVLFLIGSSYLPTVKSILDNSILALGLQICFYLGVTSLASAWHFRDRLKAGPVAAITHVLWPLTSALVLAFVALYSIPDLSGAALAISAACMALAIIPYLLAGRRQRREAD